MKETSEETTNRILAALRDVDPPADMRYRILQAVDEHAASASSWHRWIPKPRILGTAALASVLLLLSLAAFHFHHDKQHPLESTQNPPAFSPPPVAPTQSVVAVAKPSIHLAHSKPVTTTPVQSRSNDDAEDLAVSEMRAPSHPAPELPLTAQEKLLLRVLRSGDLDELAELDPATRAEQHDEETTEFQNFFAHSISGDDQ